ncbi:MAG: FkbM family methyltransferase [Candidatus Udaeobacter sp.]
MGALETLWVNLTDIPTLGIQFLWRHAAFAAGADTTKVNVPGIGNVHLRCDQSDASVFRQVFRYLEYDTDDLDGASKRIYGRYTELIESGKTPVIVDAGANIGAASIWFKKKYEKAAIVAVEPEPGNFEVLKKNTEHIPGISTLAAAIGSESGFVSITNEGQGWSATTERATDGVPIVTMDEAFKSVPGGSPFIAKIDIEGFESDLFSHNLGWLEQVYVVFIEPHDWRYPGRMLSQTFQRATAAHDFELYIIAENLVYVRI